MKKSFNVYIILCLFISVLLGCNNMAFNSPLNNKAKITFESEFGEVPPVRYVEKGTRISVNAFPRLRHTGYQFEGWDSADVSIIEGDSIVVDKDIKIVAKWKKTSLIQGEEEVRFDPDPYGDTKENPYSIDFGTLIKLSARYGGGIIYYTTDGTKPEYGNEKQLYTKPIVMPDTQLLEINAIGTDYQNNLTVVTTHYFTVSLHNVCFDLNYETTETIPEIKKKKGDVLKPEEIPVPTRKGYKFMGWYDNKGRKFDENYIIDDYLEVRASWLKDDLFVEEIILSNNGGDVDYGEKISLSCNTPGAVIYYDDYYRGRDSYEDIKRYGEKYTEPLEITSSKTYRAFAEVEGMGRSNIVSASYFVKDYQIEFNENGADNVSHIRTETGVKGKKLQLRTDLKKENCEFDGWYDGYEKVSNDYEITKDAYLIAHWKNIQKVQDVIFSSEGAYNMGDRITLSCPTPNAQIYYSTNKMSSYELYTSPIILDNNIKYISAYATKENMIASDYIRANYNEELYTVNYDTNGVKVSDYIFSEENIGWGWEIDIPKIHDTQNEKFIGWYDGVNKVDSKYKVTKNVTLVAQWQKPNKVPNVLFNITNGEFNYGDKLTLSCPLDGGVIKYKEGSTTLEYTEPIVLKYPGRIEVWAEKEGYEKSEPTYIDYKIRKYTVSFDLNGGKAKSIYSPHNEITMNNREGAKNSFLTVRAEYYMDKPYHKFIGWYDGNTLVSSIDKNNWVLIDNYKIEKDVTLTARWEENPVAEDVTFSETGWINAGSSVDLCCATPNVDIYYTTDGSDPADKNNSNRRKGNSIFIDKDTTVKAVAYKENEIYPSRVVSCDFKVRKYKVYVMYHGLKDWRGTTTFEDKQGEFNLNNNLQGFLPDNFGNIVQTDVTFEGWYSGTKNLGKDPFNILVSQNMVIYPKCTQKK